MTSEIWRCLTLLMLAGGSEYDEARKLADAAAAEGLLKLAETKLEKVLQIKPDNMARCSTGVLYSVLMRSARATRQLRGGIVRAGGKQSTRRRCGSEPDYHAALNNWGTALAAPCAARERPVGCRRNC